jgi:hypothetical protein
VIRRLLVTVTATALVAALAPTAGAQTIPPTPPRDRWYAQNDTGHWSDGTRVRIDQSCLGLGESEAVQCSLEAFKAKPFTVIAFVDTGINPYHQDFRAPEFIHDPSTFIEGYPGGAERVDLSFDVADANGYDAARAADAGVLAALRRNRLYWFPGTRVVGGVSVAAGGTGAGRDDFAVIDESSHGTGVASVAAGRYFGSNPNALIVIVEGLGNASVAWATSQPWIDVVSNSWGPGLPGRVDPLGSVEASRAATRRGQSVLFSAGNGMRNTNSSNVFPASVDPCKCKIPTHNVTATSYTSGPSWVLTIGAVSPVNGQAHWWHGIPVDAASFGSKWAAADAFGVARGDKRDFGGTSCATPITAGVLSAVIDSAREVLGDRTGGQRAGAVVAEAAAGVAPPGAGPLADGKLTRAEAEEITLKSAQPVPFDAEKLTWDYAVEPTTDTYWVQQGYGVVDRASKDRALKILLGELALPDRADVDRWVAATDAARNALYGNP